MRYNKRMKKGYKAEYEIKKKLMKEFSSKNILKIPLVGQLIF